MPIPVRLPRPLLAMLLLSPGACERQREAPPIPDETFIEVMVDLRRAAAVNNADTSGFAVIRDSILAAAGVDDAALYAWVNATSRDPQRMGRVFEEIRDSMRAQPDTVSR